MQEPYEEGPASHLDPESCADGREAGREALTGARADAVSSCDMNETGVPSPSFWMKATPVGATYASPSRTPRSQRPAVRSELLHAEPGISRGHRRAQALRSDWGRPRAAIPV